MKKHIFWIIIVTLLLGACDEEAFLEEKPLDFMSANNSYTTKADFDAAIVELYHLTRLEFYCNGGYSMDYLFGTDLVRNNSSETILANLSVDYNPTANIPKQHWDNLYLLIAQSNVAINRVHKSGLTEEEKTLYEAKAKFFRGFAFRTLAYLYGGVPLVVEEVTSPKADFVRSSREATLLQAVEDVKFAAENLEDIDEVKDGEISSPAAYHLLSELYIATNQNQLAVDAATMVIGNTNLALMQNRFGRRASVNPGDVYWDLFQRGNQNRALGNTEGLFVIQFEMDVLGGGASSSTAFYTVPGNYLLERYCAPQTGLFRIKIGRREYTPFLWPVGDYTGGRGIGSAGATLHFHDEVWASDFNSDIRNANHNFVRRFAYNSPEFLENYSDMFGDTIDISNPNLPEGATLVTGLVNPESLPGRYLTGYQTKCTTPFDHPEVLYANPATYSLINTGTAGSTSTDQYMFRFAETYLLRAEAYLKLSQTDNAADDINIVRARAKASLVTAAEVDLDYILDERMRELGIEEKRRLTLGRLGTDIFYDRVTRYNPYYSDPESTADGLGFLKKYTLWPIPQSAIEANKDAVLEQNIDWVQ